MLIGEKGTTSDTLVMSDFIQVSLLENEPVVFPNPATSQSILNVDFKERIERIELVSLNGKLVQQWEKVTQYINLPQTRAGIYFLNVIANDTKYTSKLVLN